MTELNVPFLEKDEAKKLGARWNNAQKRWYVPSGIDLAPFSRWLPDISVVKGISEESMPASDNVTLAQFLTQISSIINRSFAKGQWVSAEISELRINKGHMFITLVEHDESGNMVARTNARIWQSQVELINEKFKQGTGSNLEAGIKVLIFARCEFHSQYGLALFIDDIDPSYTIGDMAVKLAQIREILIKEKVIDNNKRLPKPQDFTRVAVISPANAAGLGDFNREAQILMNYNLCHFEYFTAQFQGNIAPREIKAALDHALLVHNSEPFDAIVIIRGGGALSDLAWLNNEHLARAVCLCPVHIMVGIGHERDFTIIDEVAGERFDTPSKVIQRIFNVITNNATEAENCYAQINRLAVSLLDRFKDKIYNQFLRIVENSIEICSQLDKQLKLQISEILGQSPKQILKKGFAIVYDANNKVISSKKTAQNQTKLQIEFHDGKVQYEF